MEEKSSSSSGQGQQEVAMAKNETAGRPTKDGKPIDADALDKLAAEIQSHLHRVAIDLDAERGVLLQKRDELPDTFPTPELENEEPMALPTRLQGDLTILADILAEVSGNVRQVAELTPEGLRAEWERERTKDAQADAYITAERLKRVLSQRLDAAHAAELRAAASKFFDLAAKVDS
jgi:hypothetical protein